jgi:hypothetical protein
MTIKHALAPVLLAVALASGQELQPKPQWWSLAPVAKPAIPTGRMTVVVNGRPMHMIEESEGPIEAILA